MPSSSRVSKKKKVDELRDELKRVQEENELLRLKAELAQTKKENEKIASSLPDLLQASEKRIVMPSEEEEEEEEEEEQRQLYVGGLPYEESEESLKDYFSSSCGKVSKVKMQLDHLGRFTGIAFISFRDESSMRNALALDGQPFLPQPERILKIRIDRNARRRPPPSREADSLTVYAGNLPFDISKDQIFDFFESQVRASISSMRYHTDPESGNFRGFCHIEFADEISLQNAIQADGRSVRGRQLRITHSATGKKRKL